MITGRKEDKKKELAAEVEDFITNPAKDLDDELERIAWMEQLLWEILVECQGFPFETAKSLAYTYSIKGNEMFVDRKDKSLTRATVQLAFHNALFLQRKGERVSGPKKLKTFGASYLFPIFIELGIIRRNCPDTCPEGAVGDRKGLSE